MNLLNQGTPPRRVPLPVFVLIALMGTHALASASPDGPLPLPPPPEGMRELSLREQRILAEVTLPRVHAPEVLDPSFFAPHLDLPLELKPDVARFIRYYQQEGRAGLRTMMRRLTRYQPLIQPALSMHQVPLDLIHVAMIESALSTGAVSPAKAAGPWQFVPATGSAYGLRQTFWVDERRDPSKSTRAAARFLSQLHEQFGHWYLALAGYNTGGSRVRRLLVETGARDYWTLRKHLSKETREYVPKILALTLIAKHPTAFGFSHAEFDYLAPLEFEQISLRQQVALHFVAQATGTTEKHLRELNPELLRRLTPPATAQHPYRLRVPAGSARALRARLDTASRAEQLSARVHRVRRGDSLHRLARRYRTHPQVLREVNGLSPKATLRINARLLVPRPPRLASASAVPGAGPEPAGAAASEHGLAPAARAMHAMAEPPVDGAEACLDRGPTVGTAHPCFLSERPDDGKRARPGQGTL